MLHSVQRVRGHHDIERHEIHEQLQITLQSVLSELVDAVVRVFAASKTNVPSIKYNHHHRGNYGCGILRRVDKCGKTAQSGKRGGANRILAWTFNLAALQQQQQTLSWSRHGGRGEKCQMLNIGSGTSRDARMVKKLQGEIPNCAIRRLSANIPTKFGIGDLQVRSTLPPTCSNRRTPARGQILLLRLRDPIKAAVDARIPRHARQP